MLRLFLHYLTSPFSNNNSQFKETPEKVLQTEPLVTGSADRIQPFEGHLLESGCPPVDFHFAVKAAPSYSCPSMGWSTIVFLFYTGPTMSFQQGDCTQQYLMKVEGLWLKYSGFVFFLCLFILSNTGSSVNVFI